MEEEIKMSQAKFKSELKTKKEKIYKNNANGNCLFESIAQIQSPYFESTEHMRIRGEICAFIKDRIDKLSKKTSGRVPDFPIGETYASKLLDYNLLSNLDIARRENKEMGRSGVYGELNEIYAASLLYKVEIKIYETYKIGKDKMVSLTLIQPDVIKQGVYKLHYSRIKFSGGHYEAILPKTPGSESKSSSQESESESSDLIGVVYAENEKLKEIALGLKALEFTDQQIFDNLPTDKKVNEIEIDQLVSRMLDEREAYSQNNKTRKAPPPRSSRSKSPKTEIRKSQTNKHTYKESDPWKREAGDPFTTYTATKQLPSNPKYTQRDILYMVNLVNEKANQNERNKGGNKTKKRRGRRYRSFRRT